MHKLLMALFVILIPLNSYAQDAPRKVKKAQLARQKDESPSFPLFESAYFKQGHIEFKPFVKIDWESKAPEKIKSIKINNPTQNDLAYIKTGDRFFTYSSFYFDLPIPDEIAKAFYYLITNDGIIELKPAKLRGTARFDSNPAETVIADLVYYGDIVADSIEKRQVREGGFVMISMTPLKINAYMFTPNSGFTARSEDKRIIHSFIKGAQTLALSLDQDHPVKIITSFKFQWQGTDSDYIFVKWDKDDRCDFGCCSNSYSLFRANRELRELKWTRYDCDI